MSSERKRRCVEALVVRLREELDALERVAAVTREEVGSAETKQEGKYDTRSTEASYLARGQAWRIAELRQLLAWFGNLDVGVTFESAEMGSLVVVQRDESDDEELLLVAPVGGLKTSVDGERVAVVSRSSPLGEALFGLCEGDDFEVESPRGPVPWELLSVE